MYKDDRNSVELLAPAGNYESFIAAINAGANAIYMGLKKFNARAMTNNFLLEEYIAAIDYAHKRDVKVYLTLNTLLLDEEIKEALENVYQLYKVGLDGVIVQDLGIANLIHKIMPDISLHASTQMSVCTLEQVKALENMGFERVVLARELSLEEISYIAQNTKLEIEVFVHGALCVAVSGQCLMSAMIGGRSANRGSCAGPCRKKYSLYNVEGKLIEKNKYLLSKKDIFGLDKIQELIQAGVHSFKVEGRNKTPEYVAGVIKNYREAIDNGYEGAQDKEVLQLFNRSGKSDGYLKGVKYRQSISEYTPKNTGLLLGTVLQVKGDYIKVQLEEDIDLHDGIEALDNAAASTIVTCIRDYKFRVINAHVYKGDLVWLGDIKGIKKGDTIYKTSSNKLNEKYKFYASSNLRRLEYDVKVDIQNNCNLTAKVDNTEVSIDYIPEVAKTSGVTLDKVIQAFSKTETTSVKFNVTANIDDGLFVPVSKLNELRNALVEKIENLKITRREIKGVSNKIEQALDTSLVKSVEISTAKRNIIHILKFNGSLDYIEIYKQKHNGRPNIMYVNANDFALNETKILEYLKSCEVYFVIPNVTLINLTKYIHENIERLIKLGVSGIVIGNIGYLKMCKELKAKYNIELVADYTLNVTNKYTAMKLNEFNIDVLTLLPEGNLNTSDLCKYYSCEVAQDLICVMTSRYCIISSFVRQAEKRQDCKMECTKSQYYILDEQNKRYDIITENLDCITKLITTYPTKYVGELARCRTSVL